MMIFGFVTNGLVIVFSSIHRRILLTQCTIFMYSLAFYGLVYSLFQPLRILSMLNHTWSFGVIGCKLYTLNIGVYKLVVPLHLTLLDALCYMNSIYGPLSTKGSIFLVGITSIAALVSTLPDVISAHVRINSDFNIKKCQVDWSESTHFSSAQQGRFLYAFILAYGISFSMFVGSTCIKMWQKKVGVNRITRSYIYKPQSYASIPPVARTIDNTNTWLPHLRGIHLICWFPYWMIQFCLYFYNLKAEKWFLLMFWLANLLGDATSVIIPTLYIVKCIKNRIIACTQRPRQQRRKHIVNKYLAE